MLYLYLYLYLYRLAHSLSLSLVLFLSLTEARRLIPETALAFAAQVIRRALLH